MHIKLTNDIGQYLYKNSAFPIQGVSKNIGNIGNRSQICKAAEVMKFLVQIDSFGTYDVE